MLLLLKIVSSFMIQQGCFPRCWLDGVLCRASQGQGLPVSVRYFYKRVCLGLVQIECSSDCANKRYSKSWCIGWDTELAPRVRSSEISAAPLLWDDRSIATQGQGQRSWTHGTTFDISPTNLPTTFYTNLFEKLRTGFAVINSIKPTSPTTKIFRGLRARIGNIWWYLVVDIIVTMNRVGDLDTKTIFPHIWTQHKQLFCGADASPWVKNLNVTNDETDI